MNDDVLIRAEGVSKKFCRDLKRSLWYGVKDTVGDLLGHDSTTDELRPTSSGPSTMCRSSCAAATAWA